MYDPRLYLPELFYPVRLLRIKNSLVKKLKSYMDFEHKRKEYLYTGDHETFSCPLVGDIVNISEDDFFLGELLEGEEWNQINKELYKFCKLKIGADIGKWPAVLSEKGKDSIGKSYKKIIKYVKGLVFDDIRTHILCEDGVKCKESSHPYNHKIEKLEDFNRDLLKMFDYTAHIALRITEDTLCRIEYILREMPELIHCTIADDLCESVDNFMFD